MSIEKWHTIGILGAGESGRGAALLALSLGMQPFVSDIGELSDSVRSELEGAGIAYEEGRHSLDVLKKCDLIVKSPGIPGHVPIVEALRQEGSPMLSEIAFAACFVEPKKVLAITGSNGKSTTTALTAHLLRSAGLQAVAAGNIGRSFARVLAEGGADYYVLEVSSFQLEDAAGFRPHVAALLNITPDHLDRYDFSMKRYAFAKLAITAWQTEEDCFLYWENDSYTQQFLPVFAEQYKALSARQLPLYLPTGSTEKSLTVEGCDYDLSFARLMGKHNLLNAVFAIRMALLVGLSPNEIQEGLKTFKSIPHRLEQVGEVRGVKFINDSKATNVDAVRYALDAMEQPIVWIAGGVDKGNDYELLKDLVREKVKALICLGVDNKKIRSAFADLLPRSLFEVDSMEEAVNCALEVAEAGDVVLLSPACASFDLFENYEDRGNRFKQSVDKLLIAKTQ